MLIALNCDAAPVDLKIDRYIAISRIAAPVDLKIDRYITGKSGLG